MYIYAWTAKAVPSCFFPTSKYVAHTQCWRGLWPQHLVFAPPQSGVERLLMLLMTEFKYTGANVRHACCLHKTTTTTNTTTTTATHSQQTLFFFA